MDSSNPLKRSNEELLSSSSISTTINTEATSTVPTKKRSRFETIAPPTITTTTNINSNIPTIPTNINPAPTNNAIADAIAAAAARAAAIARQVQQSQPNSSTSSVSSVVPQQNISTTTAVSSTENTKRSALPPPLLLDSQGRPIDEKGNLILDKNYRTQPITTLRINDPTRDISNANNLIEIVKEKKPQHQPALSSSSTTTTTTEKINPYLAHRYLAPTSLSSTSSSKTTASTLPSDSTSNVYLAALQYDNRRRIRGERGLQFVEEGTYAHAAEEERERIARTQAYVALRQKGGRNRPVVHRDETNQNPDNTSASVSTDNMEGIVTSATTSTTQSDYSSLISKLPPKDRTAVIPEIEWWDAAYLPKTQAKLYSIKYSVAGQKALHSYENDSSILSTLSSTLQLAIQAQFSYQNLSLTACKTSELIQHPIPVLANAEPEAPAALPLMLTKKERKRLRRRRREEKFKFIQDQIRMGLLPPPEPKVRLSNLMRVLKDSAVADPSAIEAKVRNQIAERQRLNEENQLAFKLTKEEKLERLKRKLSAHPAAGPECAVFRIYDLSDKKARYKIDVTGHDCFLTGTVIVIKPPKTPSFVPSSNNDPDAMNDNTSSTNNNSGSSSRHPPGALVVVEGGTRGIRLFTKMLLRGINWNRLEQENNEDDDDDDDDDDSDDDNMNHQNNIKMKDKGAGPGKKCELVWHGTIPRNYYTDFQFEECHSLATARKCLEIKGLTHFFDSVIMNAKQAEKPYRGIFTGRIRDTNHGGKDTFDSDYSDIDDNEHEEQFQIQKTTDNLLASILQTTVDKDISGNNNTTQGFISSKGGPLSNTMMEEEDEDSSSSSDDDDYQMNVQ